MVDRLKNSISSVFFLRRLHALLGVLPLGAFLILHIGQNATILSDPNQYDAKVAAASAAVFSGLLTWVFVLLPLALYLLIGLFFIYGTRSNVGRYRHEGNVRFLFQHVSGVIALAFLSFHVWQTRWHASDAPTTQSFNDLLMMPGVASLYLIGSTATIFHFCNAFWEFLTTWGITVSRQAQRKALVLAAGVFVILSFLNGLTILKLALLPGDDTVAVAE
jgi:succinate dehydrogenase/fumarate reductase cytochrome b subunit (b558 family)